jgi:Branched-chain amino acid aminotransferase/4-amino-4-deoxychorismate lyase
MKKKNDLIVSTSNSKKKKNIPKFDKSIKFGSLTTEHMLEIDWDKTEGWTKPKIVPYHTFQLDPCNITFHYATECFEGIKAFHGVDGKIRLFRPESYLERFREACKRMTLPVNFPILVRYENRILTRKNSLVVLRN